METKATWEDWATRLVSAATIAALGYFVLFVDFTSQGRIWDKLAARVPVLARIVPPLSAAPGTVVVKTMPASEDFGDRTLVMGEQAPQEAPEQAQPASVPAAAQAPAAAAEKKMFAPRLTTSLSQVNINDNSRNRVISVPASQAPAAAAPDRTAPAAGSAPSAAPAEGTASSQLAAKTSYGAASRSEMMGPGAGPVYNLKGKSRKK